MLLSVSHVAVYGWDGDGYSQWYTNDPVCQWYFFPFLRVTGDPRPIRSAVLFAPWGLFVKRPLPLGLMKSHDPSIR